MTDYESNWLMGSFIESLTFSTQIVEFRQVRDDDGEQSQRSDSRWFVGIAKGDHRHGGILYAHRHPQQSRLWRLLSRHHPRPHTTRFHLKETSSLLKL